MTKSAITNTPSPGDTPEQIAACAAPREQSWHSKLFFLTEPEAGRFIANFQVGNTLERLELSPGQLANCVSDGAAMLARLVRRAR